jgi:hypothetical protein
MEDKKGNKNSFSMEDFEKGLMLAGYLMPNSIEELNEREQLEVYEKELKAIAGNTYFKRAVLAAEIVSKLYNEPSLGSVKFQKLVYLCEHAAKMDLVNRYKKQAAGPFDNKFMYSIGGELQKQKWFQVKKIVENERTRYKFSPLENAEKYKEYYSKYFSNDDDKIQYIIELFRKHRTDYTEMATTVFACYLELAPKGTPVDRGQLLNLFYDWSDKKKRFPKNEVLASFEWLIEKGLIADK